MHDGCNGAVGDATAVVDKVRQMGFADQLMPMPLELNCRECGEPMEMDTFEFACPKCKAVHAVTPCHAFDPDNVQSAGVGY